MLKNLAVVSPSNEQFSQSNHDCLNHFFDTLDVFNPSKTYEEILLVVSGSEQLSDFQVQEISEILSFDFITYSAFLAFYYKTTNSLNVSKNTYEMVSDVGIEGLVSFFKSSFIIDLIEKTTCLRPLGKMPIESSLMFSQAIQSITNKVSNGCIISKNVTKNLAMITMSCLAMSEIPVGSIECFSYENYVNEIYNNVDLVELGNRICLFGIPRYYADIIIGFVKSFHEETSCLYVNSMLVSFQTAVSFKENKKSIINSYCNDINEKIYSNIKQIFSEMNEKRQYIEIMRWRTVG